MTTSIINEDDDDDDDEQRIDYKVALLTFKVCSKSTPSYLHPTPRQSLYIERGRPQPATTIGHSGAVPTVHQDNSRKARIPLHSTSHLELALPKTVLDSDTVTSFKSRLKTHLFS